MFKKWLRGNKNKIFTLSPIRTLWVCKALLNKFEHFRLKFWLDSNLAWLVHFEEIFNLSEICDGFKIKLEPIPSSFVSYPRTATKGKLGLIISALVAYAALIMRNNIRCPATSSKLKARLDVFITIRCCFISRTYQGSYIAQVIKFWNKTWRYKIEMAKIREQSYV